jgi:FkbH-like protein
MKYNEIIKKNSNLDTLITDKKYSVCVLSNVVMNQMQDVLEYYIREKSIPGKVFFGEYDNIVQESFKVSDYNLTIVFWEISNYTDGLHYQLEILEKDKIKDIENKIINEIDLVFENLKNSSLALFNKFSSMIFNHKIPFFNELDEMVNRLNDYLSKKKSSNIHLIDINKVISTIGVSNSVDHRFYNSSKVLYTINFFKSYSELILPYVLAANGKKKKAIILDCDNTLWKGVIGEDGFKGINLSSKDPIGKIYHEIQTLALSLKKNHGVLLGICSKNNLSDIEQVLNEHPDMLIRNEDLAIKKVNWNDKAQNLREISEELNIGLDSIVFLDDSDFEIELIKSKIPQVRSIKVPSKIYEYPTLFREIFSLFFDVSKSAEDKIRTELYKQQNLRNSEKKKINNIEDFLSSLELSIKLFVDHKDYVPRMAQMTQKTNQFNLTTKRYTERDITQFILNKDYRVFCISVSDKFGDSGITGLCILKLDRSEQLAIIDTFLLSCRVIGRNIEHVFMDIIINKIKKEKIFKIETFFKQTPKNEQVRNFYDQFGFKLKYENEEVKDYHILINNYNYNCKNINYIKILDEK